MSEPKMHPVVAQMMEHDALSKHLGMEVIESRPGHCACQMTVQAFMVNGFGIAHGAITYALADSTLAFAVNAMGRHAVSTTSTIQHLHPVRVGDVLTATSQLKSDGHKVVHIDVEVHNQDGKLVACLTATGYKKSTAWDLG
jgi:acyl-CoA thioesterase